MSTPTRSLALATLMFSSLMAAPAAMAEGDLTTRPERLPDLVLGSEQSDYSMSVNRYELETGQAYKLKVESTGRKEYAMQAPEFFASIFLRKVEAGDMEIKAVSLTELEFEREGEAEIYFVPIKPGEYSFYMSGLEHKGMEGTFSVR
ncbi:copper-binding protein [Marinobacterium sp. AK62]|uniref:Copper-binding protein n=1 Tax=Marinobacterium alkalitolerans TaxID=1542925 RepID=A0ABS3ZDW5_9GAMM|nr:copper-binding protein [Marinobacterium alkalitolerans]MBP0049894.1 copper-binding protein [Marinobacterium alkalitolerans]